MSENDVTPKRKRTLAEDIAAAEKKLANLKERQKKEAAAINARNQKAVFALLTKKKLDTIPAVTWEKHLEQIAGLLGPLPQKE